MIPLALDEVRRLCPGALVPAPGAAAVSGVTIDSRRVEPGDLFVAVRGGRAFLDDARARGAAATLVPADVHAALAALGGAVREASPARVVAITGSMGKTSTKDILAALCRPHLRTVAAEQSFNAEIGVPLTLCRLEEDTELCVLELAMRGFGQIAELCRIARPHLGAITAVAPVHLEQVGSLEGVARAKAELLEALPRGATAVVPADAAGLAAHLRDDLEVVRVGEGADVSLRGYERLGEGSRLDLDLNGSPFILELNFSMRHQAPNVLTAVALYRALGLPLERIQEGAGRVVFAALRNQELPLADGGLLLNDCWNANPLSMRAALEHLVERAGSRRRIALLGEMAELGPDALAYHREVGEAAARAGLDALVAVGGPLAQVYLDAAPAIPEARWAPGREEALTELRALLEPGDCVLVKGARALGLETIAEALVSETLV